MGWQEDPVIGNWGLSRGKRTGRKSQPMPVADSPEVVSTPQLPAPAAPSLAQPQSAAAPVQQQPQAPAATAPTEQPQQPAEQQVMVGNTIYDFPADWSRGQIGRWLNVHVAKPQREKTILDDAAARGRSMYYDPESHIEQRKTKPISEKARAEYAPMIRRRVGDTLEEIKPDDVTPEVLRQFIANRKRISAIKTSGGSDKWRAWKNEYEQVAYDEDTAAMERDLERRWKGESDKDYEKRMKAAEGIEPEREWGQFARERLEALGQGGLINPAGGPVGQGAVPQVGPGAQTTQGGMASPSAPVAQPAAAAQQPPAQPLPGAGTRVENQDGTFSTERTIGVNIDGREYVIPTLVGGKQLDEQTAVNEAKRRGLQNYPSFNTVEEAEQYAQGRSAAIGGAQPPAQPPVTTEAGSEEAEPQSVWDAFRRSIASVQAHNPQGSMQIQSSPEDQATDQDKPPQREPLSMTFEAMDLSGEINPIHEPGMYALQQSGMKSIDSFPDVGSGALQQRGFDVTDPFPHAAQGQRIPVARSKSEMEKLEKIVPDGSFFWVMDDESKKAAKIPGKGAVPRRRARGNQPSPAPESGQRHTTAPVRYGIGGGSTPRGI